MMDHIGDFLRCQMQARSNHPDWQSIRPDYHITADDLRRELVDGGEIDELAIRLS